MTSMRTGTNEAMSSGKSITRTDVVRAPPDSVAIPDSLAW